MVDLLADILAVTKSVWSETIAARLAELRPEIYRGWDAASVGDALRVRGVDVVQVWARPRTDSRPTAAASRFRTARPGGIEGRPSVVAVIVIAVIVYLAFHLGAGHAHYRHARAHGLASNFYWSSVRGPYPSVRLPGGFRVGHRL